MLQAFLGFEVSALLLLDILYFFAASVQGALIPLHETQTTLAGHVIQDQDLVVITGENLYYLVFTLMWVSFQKRRTGKSRKENQEKKEMNVKYAS